MACLGIAVSFIGLLWITIREQQEKNEIKWVAIYTQDLVEGRDHTIGCGYAYDEFERATLEEAISYTKEKVFENYSSSGQRLKRVHLTHTAVELDVSAWYQELDGRAAVEKDEEIRQKLKKTSLRL